MERAIIVGAGIVGAWCAWALARRGLDVVVVDRHYPSAGATAEGMGHLVVLDEGAPLFTLCRKGVQQWHRLAQQLPEAAQWSGEGTLWLATGEEELETAERQALHFQRQGVEAVILQGEELHRREPQLRRSVAAALWVPQDRIVYPPAAVAWLLAEAESLGARTLWNTAVTAVESERVRTAAGEILEADWIVLASGLAGGALLPMLPPGVIRPRKGHLVITTPSPDPPRHQLVELGYHASTAPGGGAAVAFNLQPRPNGQLLIGSSRELDVADREVRWSVVERMVRRAGEFVRGLSTLPALRIWTGVRAAPADGLPLIGPLPEMPRVIAAFGHEGFGITTAPSTAEIVEGWIRVRVAPWFSPFTPERFLGKNRVA